jgi:hypothetical protein
MRKLLAILAMAVALLVGSVGPAAAQGEQGCAGELASELATDETYRPLGANFIRHEARDHHPYGQTTVKPLATQCIVPE